MEYCKTLKNKRTTRDEKRRLLNTKISTAIEVGLKKYKYENTITKPWICKNGKHKASKENADIISNKEEIIEIVGEFYVPNNPCNDL